MAGNVTEIKTCLLLVIVSEKIRIDVFCPKAAMRGSTGVFSIKSRYFTLFIKLSGLFAEAMLVGLTTISIRCTMMEFTVAVIELGTFYQ